MRRFTSSSILLTALLFGCSEQPTSTADSPLAADEQFERLAAKVFGDEQHLGPVARRVPENHGRGHEIFRSDFPLEIGNRWDYRRVFAVRTQLDGESPTWETVNATIQRQLIGTKEVFGREYVLERSRIEESDGGSFVQYVGYRQDVDGLYEADTIIETPGTVGAKASERLEAGAASPTLRAKLEVLDLLRSSLANSSKEQLEDEITRLAYPIRFGAEWNIRDEPLFSTKVLGLQILWTRAGRFLAWRLEIDSELFGPNDRAVFWLGPVGFLGHSFYAEGEATDTSGNPIGNVMVFERELLVGLD